MAQQIQWREPQEFSAGDTLNFERSLPDFQATDGWYIDYELRGGAQAISFQTTSDGTAHKVSVAANVTSTWAPGDYTLTGYAVNANSGERHQIYYGVFKLWENKQTAAADAPEKTFAQQMVENLEQVLLIKSNHDLAESSLGDTRFRYMSLEEVRAEHGYWKTVRRQEIAKENAKMGRPTGNRIRSRINVTPSGPIFGAQWPTGYGGW